MRNTNSAIGGYFELEISNRGSVYHDNALALNSGRNAFEYILIHKGYKRIHIPYFTCEVMLQPIKKLNLEYVFYHIDETFKPLINDYRTDDAILYTNYYGLNHHNIELLVKEFPNVIIDNAQAFFDKPMNNVNTFYSPRKFFGVPDGGFVYTKDVTPKQHYEQDNSLDRIMHLLTRIENGAESGFELFKTNDAKLDNQPIKLMSNLTKKLLNGIDFDDVINKRIHNFNFIHQHLKQTNKLTPLIDDATITCPMVYPYWINNGNELRKLLTNHKIYTALYWPNVLEWVDANTTEFELANNVVCIPIDQRCCQESLHKIISTI
jgi:hypothetical protein